MKLPTRNPIFRTAGKTSVWADFKIDFGVVVKLWRRLLISRYYYKEGNLPISANQSTRHIYSCGVFFILAHT